MALVQNDLWRHILWRPTESPCLLPKPDLLGKAKVDLRERFCIFWLKKLTESYLLMFQLIFIHIYIYIYIYPPTEALNCVNILSIQLILLDVFGRAAACCSAKNYKLHYSRGKEELAATRKPQNLTYLKYLFLILEIYVWLLTWGVQMSLHCIHHFYKRWRKCES